MEALAEMRRKALAALLLPALLGFAAVSGAFPLLPPEVSRVWKKKNRGVEICGKKPSRTKPQTISLVSALNSQTYLPSGLNVTFQT